MIEGFEKNYNYKHFVYFQDQEKDLLFICVYCHMMGYDVNFAKVKALMMLSGSIEAMDSKIGIVNI